MTLLNTLLERADLHALFNEIDTIVEGYISSIQRLQLHEGMDDIADALRDQSHNLNDRIQHVQNIRDETKEMMKSGDIEKGEAIQRQRKAVISVQRDVKSISSLLSKVDAAVD